jgi:hypothetical protein
MFDAFLAGQCRSTRRFFLKAARQAKASGSPELVKVNVENAKTFHREMQAYLRAVKS